MSFSKPTQLKYWAFDLDGTLTDSFGQYFSTLESLVEKKFSPEEKKYLIGLHPQEILAARLPAEKATQALDVLQTRSENQAHLIPTFDGMRDLCKWLKSRSHRLAIWTSRDLSSATKVINENKLSTYFDIVVSGTCVTKRKPHTEGLAKIQMYFGCEPQDIVMVGDHDHDMMAARDFGALPIRASWHSHWSHDQCDIAQEQFFNSNDFLKWTQTTFSHGEFR